MLAFLIRRAPSTYTSRSPNGILLEYQQLHLNYYWELLVMFSSDQFQTPVEAVLFFFFFFFFFFLLHFFAGSLRDCCCCCCNGFAPPSLTTTGTQITISCSTMKTSPPFFLRNLCHQKSTTVMECLMAFYFQQMQSSKQFPTSEFYGGILASAKRSSWERGGNLYHSLWCIHTWCNKSMLNENLGGILGGTQC